MKRWFVVQSKPQQEARAEVSLEQQGYEAYCPRLIKKRRYRGRWKEAQQPLFPRYLFVLLEQGRDDFAPIRSTSGVSNLVCFGGIPRALPCGLMEEIRARETERYKICAQPGDEVELANGAFAGLKGLFLAESGEERIVILLNLFGQENRVVVNQNSVLSA